MIRIKRPVLLVLILLCGSAFAAGLVAFTGDPAWTDAEGWVWHPMDAETYMESWLLVARAENGGFLFASFVVGNAGLGDHNPGLGITYYAPDGTVYAHDFKLDREDLRASTESLNLTMGDMRLWREGGKIHLKVPRDEISVDCLISPEAPFWRHGSGRMILGRAEDSWNWAVLAPRGKISGAVTVNGKSYDLAGYGYLDHTWSNKSFFDFSKSWLSMRFHGREWTVNFVQMIASDGLGGRPVYSLMITRPGKPIQYTDRVDMQVREWEQTDGYRHPVAYSLTGDLGETRLRVEAKTLRHAETIDPLRSLSSVERKVVHLLVAKPVMYRLVMDVAVTLEENEQNETEKLTAISEMLYFNQ